jgi:hypothetical protein
MRSSDLGNPQELVAYALGELPPDEAALLEARLALAPALAETVAGIRALVDTMRSDDSEAPTARAVRRAIAAALARPRRRSAAEVLQEAARVLARLVFDSQAEPALAGFRGGGEARQLAFESEVARVDLRLTPRAASHAVWRLRGRIMPHRGGDGDLGPVLVRNRVVGAPVVEAEVDEGGRFAIDVPRGGYEIMVGVAGAALALEVELG